MQREGKHILFVLRSDFHHNPGGDMVQLRNTTKALEEMGVKVSIVERPSDVDVSSVDVIQLFNIGRPHEMLPWFELNLPVSIFSIWVDFYEIDRHSTHFYKRLLAGCFGRFGMEYIKVWARWLRGQTSFPGWRYAFVGHRKSMQYAIDKARVVISSTQNEIDRLRTYFEFPSHVYVNPLGVGHVFFKQHPTRADGIVYGGYIEPRKNVLPLIRVCNKRKWQLHIYGQASARNKWYEEICRIEAGTTIHFHGHVSQQDYAKALSECRVVALPSWFETTGLAALEGAVMGKGLVVGRYGDTQEVFGPYACYVDPAKTSELETCLEIQLRGDVSDEQLTYFKQFNMRDHCLKLLDIYAKIV